VISRFNNYRAVTVNGGPKPGVSSGDALLAMEQISAKTLPPGYAFEWAGTAFQEKAASGQTGAILSLSVLFAYLFLVALYESWVIPIPVLLSVTIGVLGAFAGLLISGLSLDLYAQIGLVVLISLAAKNGILIVEFANHLQEQGLDKMSAVVEAAGTRLRPILMTTAATVIGHFPLVLATGPGAGARNSIGIMLVTGMIIGTAFTLFVVPSIYVLVAKTHHVSIAEDEAELAATEAA
jgi:hydrophobic/amphiphilic exporter-1 (mainly G- bacteria), HAE1 family